MHLRSLLLVIAAIALPSTALAQASTGELRDEPYQHRIEGEIGFFYTDTDTSSAFAFQPGFRAAIGLLQQDLSHDMSIQLDLDVRGGGLHSEQDTFLGSMERTSFRVFNPFVGVRFGHEEGERGSRWRARGGFGVTLPFSNLYDPEAGLLESQIVALALPGVWDPWLATMPNMAFVARGDVEYRNTYFFLGAESSIGFMVPVEYEGRTGDTVIAPEIGVWIAGRPVEILALGARFQAVAMINTGDDDANEGYLALTPFVRFELGAAFIESRLVMNLDDPLGFAFDDNGFWGWYIGGGAQF